MVASISAKIINFGCGSDLIRPNPYVWAGSGPPKKKKKYIGPISAQSFWVDIGPPFSLG